MFGLQFFFFLEVYIHICSRVSQRKWFIFHFIVSLMLIIFILFRWHRAVSTNLVKQKVLVPKEESPSDSDMEFHESQRNPKKNLVKKVKTVLGRMLLCKHRSKPASVHGGGSTPHKETLLSNTQSLLPRIVKELPSPKLFTKPRMRKLSQNGNQRQYVVACQSQEEKWN